MADDRGEADERLTALITDIGGFAQSHPRWTRATTGFFILAGPDGDSDDGGRECISLVVVGPGHTPASIGIELVPMLLTELQSTFGVTLIPGPPQPRSSQN